MIEETIIDSYRTAGRPVRVGFDISCCPRIYILMVLGICVRLRVATEMTFFYSEGTYVPSGAEFVPTVGDWRTVIVPHYEGAYDPELPQTFVVSVGFEGARYRSLVNRYEPDNVRLLRPRPGFNKGYTEQAIKACRPLEEEYGIQPDGVLDVRAGDAICAWRRLSEISDDLSDQNVTYLTFGPKPHILGMGLHASIEQKVCIVYRKPEGYTRMEVKPSGRFWAYRVRNLAVA